jgi:hypothetical protein
MNMYAIIEDMDYELNAQYDYIREAYAGDVESQASLDEEAAYYEEVNRQEAMDAMEARGGPAVYFFDDSIPF